MQQYDKLSKSYGIFIKTDPIKQYVQYPTMEKFLGVVKGQTILDIGCGDGLFTRRIGQKGAKIIAYDNSVEQIKKAAKHKSKHITFVLADPYTFQSKEKFDKAFSILVIPYAKDRKYLKQFFISTSKFLKNKGEFVSIIINPEYKRFGEIAYDRLLEKTKNQKIKANFLNGKRTYFTALITNFSKKYYEKCAMEAGFKKITWKNVEISKDGVEKLGNKYWKIFKKDPLNIVLIAQK